MTTSSEIIPTKVVATIITNVGTWTVNEISTRHASAIGIVVTHPFVVTGTLSGGVAQAAFATQYEAIDCCLGTHARPTPFWTDMDLADLVIAETDERGHINYTAIVGRLVRSLIGQGQLHVCNRDHVNIGEHPLDTENARCQYCEFELAELADATHNARTELSDIDFLEYQAYLDEDPSGDR